MVVFESTTPSLRDTPAVPGGELLLLLFLLLLHPVIHNFRDRAYRVSRIGGEISIASGGWRLRGIVHPRGADGPSVWPH